MLLTVVIAALTLAGCAPDAQPGTGAAPSGSSAPSSPGHVAERTPASTRPQHYDVPGAHLRQGHSTPTRDHVTGNACARTVVYVVGDSMAGQLAYPTHLARPSWAVKPRTKSSTPFQLPARPGEAGTWARAVLTQMRDDVSAGKRVIAIISSQEGSETERRRTIHHLRSAGVAPRLATSTPHASALAAGEKSFPVSNLGPGRSATLAAAKATRTPVLDLAPIAARRTADGQAQRVVHGHTVMRDKGHLNVGFADTVLPWHLGTKLAR